MGPSRGFFQGDRREDGGHAIAIHVVGSLGSTKLVGAFGHVLQWTDSFVKNGEALFEKLKATGSTGGWSRLFLQHARKHGILDYFSCSEVGRIEDEAGLKLDSLARACGSTEPSQTM